MNTSTWAILPLRALNDGKQRLSLVLSAAERRALVEQLFRRTLAAITSSGVIAGVCVVSPDPCVLDWVAPLGVLPVLQEERGLNQGLEHARRVILAEQQVDALLVVLPDLPLVAPADIAALVQRAAPRAVVLAPDRHEQGTNALLVRPARALPFCFGEGSFDRHRAAARNAHLAVHVLRAQGTAFDVDTPDDLYVMEQPLVGTDTDEQVFPFSVPPCLRGA
jgi:2-phospho-L-lactate guanylyltransferase